MTQLVETLKFHFPNAPSSVKPAHFSEADVMAALHARYPDPLQQTIRTELFDAWMHTKVYTGFTLSSESDVF